MEAMMKSRAHPEQAYRACLGVFRLSKNYPAARLEAAAQRALRYNLLSYRSIDIILKRGMDQTDVAGSLPVPLPSHENIRGEGYYQ